MKTCHKCRLPKDLEDFPINNTRKDGRSETCLECKREYNRLHYQKNRVYYMEKAQAARDRTRAIFRELKSKLKCNRCPQNHIAALQFHHTDPATKEFDIGYAASKNWSMTRIMEEIAKCEVLCASCHAIHHWEEKNGGQ
jgi:hypothetical protein